MNAPRSAAPIQPTAFSYIRFSSPEQAKGDSLRRQEERAAAYCQRRGWTLDTALTLRDLGVSAFRGKNALVGNLGVFLRAVKQGTVRPGSALIVESVDRISRQGIDEGYDLIKGILKAGVILVTLSPEREFGPDAVKSLSKGALELQLILERAAEESERKSDRIGGAWAQKRKKTREGGLLTRRLPAWLSLVDGKPALVAERAAVVKRIFEMAAGGYGIPSIIAKLTADKVPPIGRKGAWTRSYVNILLKDRRAVGELQLKRGKDKDGPPVANYFPPVVTEQEYHAARAGAADRLTHKGRIGKAQVNPFAGLLRNARDGETYIMTPRYSKTAGKLTRRFAVLVNSGADEGRSRSYSFPFDVFANAILSALREVDPREVLGQVDGPDESLTLACQLAAQEARIDQLKGELLKGDVAAIAQVLRDLEGQTKELARQLADARQRAASPASEAWGEAQGLAEALATAPDQQDARLRLRAALRRIIDSIHMLVVAHGRDRLCEAQVWFAGGEKSRTFLIAYRPAGFRVEERWGVRCIDHPEASEAGLPFNTSDLRNPDEARDVVGYLEALPKGLVERLLSKPR